MLRFVGCNGFNAHFDWNFFMDFFEKITFLEYVLLKIWFFRPLFSGMTP